MLTTRGWWFLTVSGTAAVLGLLVLERASPTVPILGLTFLIWFLTCWVRFSASYRSFISRLEIERGIVQGGREVATAWSQVPCLVRVTVTPRGTLGLPLLFAEDRLPAGATRLAGENRFAGEVYPDRPAVFEYDLRPEGPGVLRFEGVALRVADLCGFFYQRAFVRDRMEFLVLPQLVDDQGRHRAGKRFNTLPPPGVHRLRRPGGGSELLDLRDYRPGDPPKMIAWKSSARRDRLITKEFESDVPVRCVLFLDTSQSLRVGPVGRTPLVRLVETAAAVAQAATGNRDLVGLTTFDESAGTALAPARTRAHTIRVLGRLAEAAALLPDRQQGSAESLLKAAYPLAQELYPELMAGDLNTKPLGMYWRPLLDSRWGWLIFLPLALTPLLTVRAAWFNACVDLANHVRPRTGFLPVDILGFLAVLGLILFGPTTLALMFWFVYGVRGFLDPGRTHTRRRKQLGAVFATLDGGAPGAIERYLRDDQAFSDRAGKFLTDHRVRIATDAAQPGAEQKVEVLASAILRAVTAARDNELYVILADLNEVADACDVLVRAVRVARAKHHHVLVIIPWPEGVPAPAADGSGRKRPVAAPAAGGRLRIAQLVQSGLIRQYQRRFTQIRSELTAVGATVFRLTEGDPVRVVLDRLDRLRGSRTRS